MNKWCGSVSLPVYKIKKQHKGEPREVGWGWNELCLFFGQDYFRIKLFGHDHINFTSGHAIQTSSTFYLAAFGRSVKNIENLYFWIVLLRVKQSNSASPFQFQFLRLQADSTVVLLLKRVIQKWSNDSYLSEHIKLVESTSRWRYRRGMVERMGTVSTVKWGYFSPRGIL